MKNKMNRCCCDISGVVCFISDFSGTTGGGSLANHPDGDNSEGTLIEDAFVFNSSSYLIMAYDFLDINNFEGIKVSPSGSSPTDLDLVVIENISRTGGSDTSSNVNNVELINTEGEVLYICLNWKDGSGEIRGADPEYRLQFEENVTVSPIHNTGQTGYESSYTSQLEFWEHPDEVDPSGDQCPDCVDLSGWCDNCCSPGTPPPQSWSVEINGFDGNAFWSGCTEVDGTYIVDQVPFCNHAVCEREYLDPSAYEARVNESIGGGDHVNCGSFFSAGNPSGFLEISVRVSTDDVGPLDPVLDEGCSIIGKVTLNVNEGCVLPEPCYTWDCDFNPTVWYSGVFPSGEVCEIGTARVLSHIPDPDEGCHIETNPYYCEDVASTITVTRLS